LGCNCPEEVFQYIDCRTVVNIDENILPAYEINIGNRLLIFAAGIDKVDSLRSVLSKLVQAGIPNLFQGADPVEPRERRGEVYPGDRDIHDEHDITIQIHNLNLRSERTGPIQYESVPNIAIWIPGRFSSDVLIQDQGGVQESNE